MNRLSPRLVRMRRFQAGVGLMTAIFLLVVLAGLGAASITIFTSQRTSAALDVQSSRAYQAARAGIEWGAYKVLQTNRSCDATGNASTSGTITFSSIPSLSGFTVTVQCERYDSIGADRFIITSTACSKPGTDGKCPNQTNSPDYVARKIEVEL
jgi:MSHA biogenesis protein MshP